MYKSIGDIKEFFKKNSETVYIKKQANSKSKITWEVTPVIEVPSTHPGVLKVSQFLEKKQFKKEVYNVKLNFADLKVNEETCKSIAEDFVVNSYLILGFNPKTKLYVIVAPLMGLWKFDAGYLIGVGEELFPPVKKYRSATEAMKAINWFSDPINFNENKKTMAKISREKQLTIALLKEKIEKATGKKVVFEESKEDKLKRLIEQLEKVTGKKVVFESEETEKTPEELEEGLFGKKSDAEFQKEYQTTINLWTRKGYKQPDINAIMAAAKADKFEGKLGVDKEKNIIYRAAKDIKWQNQFAGGGTGTATGGTSGA